MDGWDLADGLMDGWVVVGGFEGWMDQPTVPL